MQYTTMEKAGAMFSPFETTAADRPEHTHIWGAEEWIINTDQYCGKLLWIKSGFQSSLHYHKIKTETFLCLRGTVLVEYYPKGTEHKKEITVLKGWARDAIHLPNGVPHRFMAKSEDALVVEFSTYHSDEDVVRLEESKASKEIA